MFTVQCIQHASLQLHIFVILVSVAFTNYTINTVCSSEKLILKQVI